MSEHEPEPAGIAVGQLRRWRTGGHLLEVLRPWRLPGEPGSPDTEGWQVKTLGDRGHHYVSTSALLEHSELAEAHDG